VTVEVGVGKRVGGCIVGLKTVVGVAVGKKITVGFGEEVAAGGVRVGADVPVTPP